MSVSSAFACTKCEEIMDDSFEYYRERFLEHWENHHSKHVGKFIQKHSSCGEEHIILLSEAEHDMRFFDYKTTK